jgi:hypothetical protein
MIISSKEIQVLVFFGGQVPREAFAANEFVSFDLLEFSYIGKQQHQQSNLKLTTISY